MYQGELPICQSAAALTCAVAGQFTSTFISDFSLSVIHRF